MLQKCNMSSWTGKKCMCDNWGLRQKLLPWIKTEFEKEKVAICSLISSHKNQTKCFLDFPPVHLLFSVTFLHLSFYFIFSISYYLLQTIISATSILIIVPKLPQYNSNLFLLHGHK